MVDSLENMWLITLKHGMFWQNRVRVINRLLTYMKCVYCLIQNDVYENFEGFIWIYLKILNINLNSKLNQILRTVIKNWQNCPALLGWVKIEENLFEGIEVSNAFENISNK